MTTNPFARWTSKERDELRLIRLNEGWSYQKMADLIGIPRSTLESALETSTAPRDTTVHKIRAWRKTYRPSPKSQAVAL